MRHHIIMWLLAYTIPAAAQHVHEHSTCESDSINPKSEAILSEVTVTGLTGIQRMKDSPIAFSVVTPRNLHLTSGTNIVDIIAHEPGVSQITTGAGIAKPVIRGLGYNRVVVVDQGIRQEGQQWGDEHGLEVDAEGVHSVEILKGPASLMYGSDAIAGVLVLNPEQPLADGTMQARVGGEYQSNNGLYNYHAGFAGNVDGWVWSGHLNDKAAHCYKNQRDGYIPGTWYKERDIQAMMGMQKRWGHAYIRLSHVDFTPGITEGERATDSTGAYGALLWPEGNVARRYASQLPLQRVLHTKVVSDNAWYIGQGTLKAIVGYQQNYRREYEDVLNEAELAMRLHTINYDIRYQFPLLGRRHRSQDTTQTTDECWTLSTGINGMWQQNANKAEDMLIPDYELIDFGYFLTAAKQFGSWHLSGGARVDNRHLSTHEATNAGQVRFARLADNFTGITGSLGAVYNMNAHTNLRLNLARGFRAPTVSELSSDGVHEGSIQYELGNPNLHPEYSTQIDLGMDYTSHYVSFNASLFTNWINNYIFLARLPYDTDGYHTYSYRQGDARLMGGEVSVDVHPINAIHIANSFAYVRGIQRHEQTDKDLPMMPAPRWTSNVSYELPTFAHGHCQRTFVSIGMDYNLKQSHYLATEGTETPTPAYALVNIAAGMDLHLLGHNCIKLSVCCQNLLNKVYQSHLSRLKYADGLGIAGMGRNVCVKVNIPIDIHLPQR